MDKEDCSPTINIDDLSLGLAYFGGLSYPVPRRSQAYFFSKPCLGTSLDFPGTTLLFCGYQYRRFPRGSSHTLLEYDRN